MTKLNLKSILANIRRPSSDANTYDNCPDCTAKVFSLFCTSCAKRFCHEHIDQRNIHPCELTGLTKKSLKHFAQRRALPLSEVEQAAYNSGLEMRTQITQAKASKRA